MLGAPVIDADLEHKIASAVYAVTLYEQAAHDDGPWYLGYGPFEIEATRSFDGFRITFTADFPEHCYLVVPQPLIWLKCRDTIRSMQSISHPGDGAWTMHWALTAQTESAVPA